MSSTPKCDAAIARLTPPNWLDQAAARQAARVRWFRLATAERPNFVLLAGAESELFAAGGTCATCNCCASVRRHLRANES